MPTALELAQDQYAQQQQLVQATAAVGLEMWQQINPANLSASWAPSLARLVVILRGAQIAAASTADAYTTAVLAAQGIDTPADGQVAATAFSGVASDGRPLESLLLNPVIATKQTIDRQLRTEGRIHLDRALAVGQASLAMTLRTQVADAGRVAEGVAITARRDTGYVRMLSPPSCSRCAILAGKFYRFNIGFERHPQCDCIHIPARNEEAANSEGLLSDPKEYFDSLTEPEQDKAFTKDGAQAIRDGADMAQVVNARRGAAGLAPAGARITKAEKAAIQGGERAKLRATTVFGQEVFLTTEGTTKRGLAGKRLIEQGGKIRVESAETVTRQSKNGKVQRTVRRQRVQTPRLMPESIYQLAGSREEAVRLLKRFGYIL